MEEPQIRQITNNLTELAKETSCSAEFIEMFTSRNFLDPSHVTNLESPVLTPMEKSKTLYEVLTKQPGSFDVLIQALEETKQIKALKTLLDCTSIFRNYGVINYNKEQVLRPGYFTADKMYKGRFGGRDIAVKVMNADITEAKVALREVDMLKKLDNHENILRYFTVETREGSIHIALELFKITLQDEMKLNLVNVIPVKILKECSAGVAYIHSRNVIHTDLNPVNILLKENGQVKLCNFGLAQQMITGMESVIVNLENVRNKDWMAPELLKHFVEEETESHRIEVSAACDIFSLGCIFFLVLSKGVHPFGNPVLRQSNIYYDKPQLQNSTLDSKWLQLVKRMISTASSDRPSAREVSALLNSCFLTETCTASTSQREMPTMPKSPDQGVNIKLLASSSNDLTPNLSQPAQLGPDLEITNKICIPPVVEKVSEETATTTNQQSSPCEISVPPESPCSSNDLPNFSQPAQLGPDLKITSTRSIASIVEKVSQDTATATNQQSSPSEVNVSPESPSSSNDIPNFSQPAQLGPDLKIASTRSIASIIEKVSQETAATTNKRTMPSESNTPPETPCSSSKAKKQKISSQTPTEKSQACSRPPVIKQRISPLDRHIMARLPKIFTKRVSFPVCPVKAEWQDHFDELGNNAIFRAVLQGKELSELKRIVEKGSDVKRVNNAGDSILHLAINHKDPQVLKFLISAGADVNAKNKANELPIHKLMETKDSFREKLTALCENGANINAEDAGGNTILELAALNGREKDDVQFIISKSGNWKRINKDQQTVLHLSVDGGNPEVVELLIKTGININVKESSGVLPVHRISFAKKNFKETLNMLLANGASINAIDEDGDSVLGWSAEAGRSKADLEYIISKGGDQEGKNFYGQSILHWAAKGGNPEAIKFLIELGGNVNLKDRFEETPLHQVARTVNDFKGSLNELLEHGANINEQNQFGNTLLMLSTFEGRPKVDLEYIVEKGGNWKLKNKHLSSVLHVAAQVGNIEAIKYFVCLGVPTSSMDSKGRLALHDLILNIKNFEETLNVLLECGASINATDQDGYNLLTLAAWHGRTRDIFECIIRKGGDYKKKNKFGQSILHMSALSGNIEAIKYFLPLGCKVNARDKDGDVPMHLLAYAKNYFKEGVQLFLEHGSKINVKNKARYTLLDLAVMQGKEEEELKYIVSRGAVGKMYD